MIIVVCCSLAALIAYCRLDGKVLLSSGGAQGLYVSIVSSHLCAPILYCSAAYAALFNVSKTMAKIAR